MVFDNLVNYSGCVIVLITELYCIFTKLNHGNSSIFGKELMFYQISTFYYSDRQELVCFMVKFVLNQLKKISVYPKKVSVNPKMISVYPKIVSVNPKIVSAYPKTVSVNPKIVSAYPKIVSVNPKIVSAYPKMVSVNPKIVSAYPRGLFLRTKDTFA